MKIAYSADTSIQSDLRQIRARAARRTGEAGSVNRAVNDRMVRDIDRVMRLTAEFQSHAQNPFLHWPSPLMMQFHHAAITNYAHALGCLADLQIHLRDTMHRMPPLLAKVIARERPLIDLDLLARNTVMEQETAIYKNNKALVDAFVSQSVAWWTMPYQLAFGGWADIVKSWSAPAGAQAEKRGPVLRLVVNRI